MPTTPSVIISCAGTGSRLGLAKTKALIEINGRTLISMQLEQLKNVTDVRIVVGYQANDVVEEVLKYRSDAIFVFNHNYFATKTGTSFYLGARHANDYVMAIDGDLLVHPNDMKTLLATKGEYIAYTDKSSEESVWVYVNDQGEVTSFSTQKGNYEWTGTTCIHKSKLTKSTGNVFNQLEPYLPMKGIKIRAHDIDTYNDYLQAIQFVNSW